MSDYGRRIGTEHVQDCGAAIVVTAMHYCLAGWDRDSEEPLEPEPHEAANNWFTMPFAGDVCCCFARYFAERTGVFDVELEFVLILLLSTHDFGRPS